MVLGDCRLVGSIVRSYCFLLKKACQSFVTLTYYDDTMQVNFTRKIVMTEKKLSSNSKGVKLLDDAVKEYGSIPDVQAALIQVGVRISHTALYNAYKGVAETLKPRIIVALAHLVYKGDWKKCGKALEADYMPEALKR